MIAYLAYPMDLAFNPTDGDLYGQTLVQVRRFLYESEVDVYDPRPAFALSASPGEGVHRVNMAALSASNMLVAVWFRGQQSVGVPLELAKVNEKRQGTRSLLVHDGWVSESVSARGAWPYTSLAVPGKDLESKLRSLVEEARVYELSWRQSRD